MTNERPKGMFLLSIEEYERYKDKIGAREYCWWLRSPGRDTDFVAGVNYSGRAIDHGYVINNYDYGVCPALYVPKAYLNDRFVINGREMVRYSNIDWIALDEETGLYLSAYPLFFDKFDDESNDYENSYIKSKLDELSRDLVV